MSSCAFHLHTCSSHAFEHFSRCPFCIPALRSPPVVISSFLSCVEIEHFRIGPKLVKRPWFTTGRPPVKFRTIWTSFGTPTVNRGTEKVSCLLQPNTPPILPKTHQTLLHALEHSITIAWPKTAPHLDSPSSTYAYKYTPLHFRISLSLETLKNPFRRRRRRPTTNRHVACATPSAAGPGRPASGPPGPRAPAAALLHASRRRPRAAPEPPELLAATAPRHRAPAPRELLPPSRRPMPAKPRRASPDPATPATPPAAPPFPVNRTSGEPRFPCPDLRSEILTLGRFFHQVPEFLIHMHMFAAP